MLRYLCSSLKVTLSSNKYLTGQITRNTNDKLFSYINLGTGSMLFAIPMGNIIATTFRNSSLRKNKIIHVLL